MLTDDRVLDAGAHVAIAAPNAGVIEDARSRQRRRRRAGVAISLAAALVVAIASWSSGGGDGGGGLPPSSVSMDGPSFVRTADLRLREGRTTTTIVINAPAGRAFDVSLRSASSAAVALTTSFGPWPSSTFTTQDDRRNCRAAAGRTSCVIHFAAGGNQGGTWKWRLTKTSGPAAAVRLSVVFAARRGDYAG